MTRGVDTSKADPALVDQIGAMWGEMNDPRLDDPLEELFNLGGYSPRPTSLNAHLADSVDLAPTLNRLVGTRARTIRMDPEPGSWLSLMPSFRWVAQPDVAWELWLDGPRVSVVSKLSALINDAVPGEEIRECDCCRRAWSDENRVGGWWVLPVACGQTIFGFALCFDCSNSFCEPGSWNPKITVIQRRGVR